MTPTGWALLAGLAVAVLLVLAGLLMQVNGISDQAARRRAASALTDSLSSLRESREELSDGRGMHRDDGETRDLNPYR
jgi:hypothetical protein